MAFTSVTGCGRTHKAGCTLAGILALLGTSKFRKRLPPSASASAISRLVAVAFFLQLFCSIAHGQQGPGDTVTQQQWRNPYVGGSPACYASINYGATVGDPEKAATGEASDLPVFVGSFTILNHDPGPRGAATPSNGQQPGWVLGWTFAAGEKVQVRAENNSSRLRMLHILAF